MFPHVVVTSKGTSVRRFHVRHRFIVSSRDIPPSPSSSPDRYHRVHRHGSQKEAKRYLDKYKRLETALDAFFSDGSRRRPSEHNVSISKINALFDKYKGGDEITMDGTLRLCEDLHVDPEDIVLLAVAYELHSPRIGEWKRKGWIDGLRKLGCDTLESIGNVLPGLREKIGSDPSYFRAVYNHTFSIARSEGQRSLATDTALAYWELLLPFGLSGGALKHISADSNDVSDASSKYSQPSSRYSNRYQDRDIDMEGNDDGGHEEDEDEDEQGWEETHTQWWFEFIKEKGGKGVSKDTWQMVRFFLFRLYRLSFALLADFIRTIDAKFKKHDETAAWPSTIDEFVEWARKKKLKT
ncbi:hypothetical protein ID866_3271 [Astraeus odoratus]|nr:hypothetical protein ID866_3271 [Astraeus odoratus]